jgi:repressor LexA
MSGHVNKRQADILEYVKAYWDRVGYSPSIREIQDDLGISSTSVVNYNLNVLVREGLITRALRTARSILVVTRR